MSELSQSLVARRFEKVRAQVDRRPFGERAAFLGGDGAKARLELGGEPFGKIAGHMRRRARKIGSGEARALGVAERRRRMALSGEERGYGLGVKAACLPQRAQDLGAR